MSKSSNFRKMNNAMKMVWLAITAVSLIMVIVMGFVDGWEKWAIYFIFPGIAFLMYLFRRFAGNRVAETIEKKENAERQ